MTGARQCLGMVASLRVRIAVLVLGLGAFAATDLAADEPVDLEIVLAVDVSGSIDAVEGQLQREGYIATFLDSRVAAAIRAGYLGRIAVTYFEWAGFGHNKIIAEWTVIDGPDSARAFARVLAEAPIETARRTSISGAIDFAVPLFDGNGYSAPRRVIDVSGDGANNFGRLVNHARDDALAAGVTINGLPVVNPRPSPFGRPSLRELDLYYESCVIGGPGAFYVVAESFEEFPRAILRKLILEIAGRGPVRGSNFGVVPAQYDGRTVPPCDVGERLWRDLFPLQGFDGSFR